MKTVFSCDECGYRYAKAWYEPMWLARRQYVPEHPNVHIEWAYAMANPNSNPIAQSWVRGERARIIALLNRECSCDSINPYQEKSCDACQYVALIKGENE